MGLAQGGGAFTPELQFGGGTTGITYASRSGAYYRLGSLIVFSLTLELSNIGTDVGNMTIEGLPLENGNEPAAISLSSTFLTLTPTFTSFQGALFPNSSSLTIFQISSNEGSEQLNESGFNNNSSVTLSGSYVIAT